jgi:hypothetical protein
MRFNTTQKLIIASMSFLTLCVIVIMSLLTLQPEAINALVFTSTVSPIPTATLTVEPTITLTRVVLPPTWTPGPTATVQPFELKPSTDPGSIPTATIDVATLQAVIDEQQKSGYGGKYLSISFSDMTTEYFGDIVEIRGVAHNNGNFTIYSLQLRFILYDNNGQHINNSVWFIDSDRFEPGTSSTFTSLVSDPNHSMARIESEIDSYFYYENGRIMSYP